MTKINQQRACREGARKRLITSKLMELIRDIINDNGLECVVTPTTSHKFKRHKSDEQFAQKNELTVLVQPEASLITYFGMKIVMMHSSASIAFVEMSNPKRNQTKLFKSFNFDYLNGTAMMDVLAFLQEQIDKRVPLPERLALIPDDKTTSA